MKAFRHFLLLLLTLCFVITSNAQLYADFTTDKAGGCSPITINFTNLTSGASANATYSWDFGNGNMSSLKNPSAIYLQEKTYTVTLTVTDGTQSSTRTKTVTVYKKPVVDFTVTAAKVCLPQAAQFNSTSSAGDGFISNYQWDFGDGSTQQGYSSQMAHYYNNEQTATVSLTVTNSHGCQSSLTKPNIIEILPRIDPVFTVSTTQLCNLDETIQLTNNSTGPGMLSYSWNFGDGTNSSQKDPVHQFTREGVYPVSLTVSNTDGCSATSYATSVNAAYFNTDFNNNALCREIGFTSTSYLYPTSSLWKFGDGNSVVGNYGIKHTYASAGIYDVTLINTYNSCKDTITKTITVQDQVNFNSQIETPSSVCIGGYTNFTSKSSVAPGWMTWDFGDGGSYTTNYPSTSHFYSQPGTYTVKLINTFGTCSETVTKNVVVNSLPDPKGFIADYGGVCGSPVTIKFTDTTAGAVAWQWKMDYNYNSFSNLKTPSYNFVSDGYHIVYLTVTNAAGCSQTTSKPVNVFRPSVSIVHNYSSSPRGHYDCDSLDITFAVNSNQTIQSYLWNLGNGEMSTDANPHVRYNRQGYYTITLNYKTESGCSGTASYGVHVYGKPKADFSYSIPCGNSLNLQFTDRSFFSDQWQWAFGDGGSDYFTANPRHNYSDTGKYMVRFISHIGHCSDTTYKEVYANVLPSSVTITKAETSCEGARGTVTFDQRSVRATGGTWDFGDGTTQPYDTAVHIIKHTYTSTGTYQVRLTGYYNGCTLVSTVGVHVLLKQNPLLTANKTQICANGSIDVQLTNMQTNPYTGNVQYGQYYIEKFEHNDGTSFNGSGSYYNWQYANYSSTLQNFTAGTTQLRAIIRNGYSNCLDTSNYISLLVNGPRAGFSIQNNNQCFKSAFVFIDTSRSTTSTALSTWYWDFGDGTYQTANSSSQVTHVYKNPGNYTVRLTVTDAGGCSSVTTRTVNARGAKAAFTASGLYVPNVPLNTTVTFYNYSNTWSSGNINYTWIYGDGATATNYTGSHTYTQAGTYMVMLIAVDPATSCADTAKQVIQVKDFQTAFAFTSSFIGNNSCPPVLLRINNLSVGYTRLVWDFGDGTTSTNAYPTHTYYNPGVYKITLYTYGYNGLTGTYIDSVEVNQPAADISADILQACTSQSVQLQTSTTNTNNFVWDFGDGLVAAGTNSLSHTYTAAGIYQPKLIAKNNNGCAASVELNEKIIIDSLNIAIKGIPSLVCDSAVVNFTPDVYNYAEAKTGTALIYKWDFGTGNAADTSNLKNPSFRFTRPGTYRVKFTVRSQFGCFKEITESVVVHPKPDGAITAVPEICQDGSIQFKGASVPSDNVQWNWKFGNGNTSTQQHPASQTYVIPAAYSVTMIVTRNGCTDTVVHALTVNPKPVVNALPAQHILCAGDSVRLSASGGGVYSWSPSSGLNDYSVASPMASPQSTGQYKVQVTTDKGCTNSDTVFITVAQKINVQLPESVDLCKGSNLQLNASGAFSYQWINNTAGLSNNSIPNPTVNAITPTTYTLVGSDNYNCFKDTATVRVIVRDLPAVNAGPDLSIVGGIPYQLNALASNDVVYWSWSPADYLSCANCPTPMAIPKKQTAYVVKVSNTWGCTSSDTVVVKLQCAPSNVYVPSAFTPGNDGKNDVFYAKGSGVNIIRHFRIYNRWGQTVYERKNIGIDDRSAGWDGKYKGKWVETGTYVYVAEMECISGEIFTFRGTVTVIK